MKKAIGLFLLVVLFIAAKQDCGTVNEKLTGRFFKSYEDYKAEKPVEGIKISGMDEIGRILSLVDENTGAKTRIKSAESPNKWFYNVKMDNGHNTEHLMRIFDGAVYYVVVDGKVPYYVSAKGAFWNSKEDHFTPGAEPEFDFISDGMDGKIKKLKNDDLNELLIKYDLKSQYDAEIINVKKTSWEYFAKFCAKKVKYFRLMNEKTK